MTEPYPGRPKVQGRCPACRRPSLFLGDGGHLTCAQLTCPNPCAADQLLADQGPSGSAGPITAADIAEVTRYATETRPPALAHDGAGPPVCEPCTEDCGACKVAHQAGREAAGRDILARADARTAFLGKHATDDDRVWAAWLREAARIAEHGTRLTARGDQPAQDTQDGGDRG